MSIESNEIYRIMRILGQNFWPKAPDLMWARRALGVQKPKAPQSASEMDTHEYSNKMFAVCRGVSFPDVVILKALIRSLTP